MSRTTSHVSWRHRTNFDAAAHSSHALTDPRTGRTHRFASYTFPRAYGVPISAYADGFEGAAQARTRDLLRQVLATVAGEGADAAGDIDVPPTRHRGSAVYAT